MPGKRSRSKSGKNTQTNKIIVENNSNYEEDDEMSEGTKIIDNNAPVTHNHATFLLLRAKVQTSTKATETLRKKLGKLLSILKESDESAAISKFEIANPNNKPISTDTSSIILNTSQIPHTITGISKYFYGARPTSKEGNVWAQFRLLHDTEIETLLVDTKEDLKNMDVSITIQTIQHYEVSHIGFLKNLHWDVDLDSLTEFFNTSLNRIHKNKEIKVGLKVKTPYDGKKRINNSTTRKAL